MPELKNTVNTMKITIESFNSRFNQKKESMKLNSDLFKLSSERRKTNKKRVKIAYIIMGHHHETKLLIMEIPEEGERKQGGKCSFKETIAENFPNLGWDTDIQIHEFWRSPNKLKEIFKTHYNQLSKIKVTILKAEKGNGVTTYKRCPHKVIIRFPSRNLAGQEAVRWYIQRVERKKMPTKNTLPDKVVCQK